MKRKLTAMAGVLLGGTLSFHLNVSASDPNFESINASEISHQVERIERTQTSLQSDLNTETQNIVSYQNLKQQNCTNPNVYCPWDDIIAAAQEENAGLTERIKNKENHQVALCNHALETLSRRKQHWDEIMKPVNEHLARIRVKQGAVDSLRQLRSTASVSNRKDMTDAIQKNNREIEHLHNEARHLFHHALGKGSKDFPTIESGNQHVKLLSHKLNKIGEACAPVLNNQAQDSAEKVPQDATPEVSTGSADGNL